MLKKGPSASLTIKKRSFSRAADPTPQSSEDDTNSSTTRDGATTPDGPLRGRSRSNQMTIAENEAREIARTLKLGREIHGREKASVDSSSRRGIKMDKLKKNDLLFNRFN